MRRKPVKTEKLWNRMVAAHFLVMASAALLIFCVLIGIEHGRGLQLHVSLLPVALVLVVINIVCSAYLFSTWAATIEFFED